MGTLETNTCAQPLRLMCLNSTGHRPCLCVHGPQALRPDASVCNRPSLPRSQVCPLNDTLIAPKKSEHTCLASLAMGADACPRASSKPIGNETHQWAQFLTSRDSTKHLDPQHVPPNSMVRVAAVCLDHVVHGESDGLVL